MGHQRTGLTTKGLGSWLDGPAVWHVEPSRCVHVSTTWEALALRLEAIALRFRFLRPSLFTAEGFLVHAVHQNGLLGAAVRKGATSQRC